MLDYSDVETHFSGLNNRPAEQPTNSVKLKLGAKDVIKFYLVHSDGYLSAETTDPRDADALVTIRELMDLATLALAYGVPLRAICHCLKYHMDGRGEHRRTNTPYAPSASSVPDLIGRYLENRFVKVPIIKRILQHGLDYQVKSRIDPVRAVAPDRRLFIDWSVDDLKEMTIKRD